MQVMQRLMFLYMHRSPAPRRVGRQGKLSASNVCRSGHAIIIALTVMGPSKTGDCRLHDRSTSRRPDTSERYHASGYAGGQEKTIKVQAGGGAREPGAQPGSRKFLERSSKSEIHGRYCGGSLLIDLVLGRSSRLHACHTRAAFCTI